MRELLWISVAARLFSSHGSFSFPGLPPAAPGGRAVPGALCPAGPGPGRAMPPAPAGPARGDFLRDHYLAGRGKASPGALL